MPELKPYTPPPPIREAWRPLAQHADQCDICLPYVSRLVGATDPRRTDFEVYEELCEEGKELFTPWRLAKDDWLAETLPRRQRQFITDDHLAADGVSFELRGEAIMSMPAKVFQEWLKLPDDVRHAKLRALENGIGHKLSGVELARVDGWQQEYWYRWRCICGADGGAESAAAAREEFAYHAGQPRKASPNGLRPSPRKQPTWRTTERLYYRERLANVELLASAVEVSWLRSLAVPIGGSRRGGQVNGDDEDCRKAMNLLTNWPGFPNLRFVPSGLGYEANVEWGDKVPEPADFEGDGWTWACGKLYGYTNAAIAKHLEGGWH